MSDTVKCFLLLLKSIVSPSEWLGHVSPLSLRQIQDMTALWLLGDTRHFCPVALKNNNVLFPCTDKEATKYREKLYYFSSPEAKDSFIESPAQYVASTGPLQV